MVPDTDFPDIRVNSIVHSTHGTLFIIPREHDQIRLYIQQGTDSDVIDPSTGRVDKNRTSPDKILTQARKILEPYRLEIKDGNILWWTVYVGESHWPASENLRLPIPSAQSDSGSLRGFPSMIARLLPGTHVIPIRRRLVRTRRLPDSLAAHDEIVVIQGKG